MRLSPLNFNRILLNFTIILLFYYLFFNFISYIINRPSSDYLKTYLYDKPYFLKRILTTFIVAIRQYQMSIILNGMNPCLKESIIIAITKKSIFAIKRSQILLPYLHKIAMIHLVQVVVKMTDNLVQHLLLIRFLT